MANTTNLNLEKPLGTDQALVSVINSNSDKIDAFAGTTNQALSKVNTVKSITASMTTNDFAEGLNAISWGYDQTIDGVTPANSMRGYLVKATNAMYGMVANANGTVVYYIGYSQNAWHVSTGVSIKTKTVTGTADSNGFFDTGLKTASTTLVSVPSLRVNDELRYAFFATPLMNGGTPAEKMALQFKNWDGNVIGKSATITATIVYFEF